MTQSIIKLVGIPRTALTAHGCGDDKVVLFSPKEIVTSIPCKNEQPALADALMWRAKDVKLTGLVKKHL